MVGMNRSDDHDGQGRSLERRARDNGMLLLLWLGVGIATIVGVAVALFGPTSH